MPGRVRKGLQGRKPDTCMPGFLPTLPPMQVLAEKFAALEGGEAGQTFASGMAAITAVATYCPQERRPPYLN